MATPARFVRGSNKLDLDNLTYYFGEDFKPPAPAREYNFASGTSLNRTGGASLVGTRAMNRPLEFTVNVRGTNEAANISAARRLISFIMAGDGLYFEWQEFPGLPEPLWGQLGAWMRYEVVTATAQLNGLFGSMGRTANVQVEVSLQVKPYALGNKQRLINAAGYVFENNYGSATGEALGLSIHEATTNKMTNPVFGHATFGNGWASSALIVTKNTDPSFCLPGVSQSAKIISPSTEAYYQIIDAGNTNKHSFSAYIYLPDGGVPTETTIKLYYNAFLSTSFKSLGNGLYLAYADNIDGINVGSAVGISIFTSQTVYLCGYQMEEKAYHTPLAYGDLLGCAWTGTAHASTSTRTATNINVTRSDDFIHLEEGAVSIVWKPYNANTFGADRRLWGLYKSDYAAAGLLAWFEADDDKVYLTDGTNTIGTSAQTFAADTPLYLTFTWGTGGLNIYKSGANVATVATYTPASTANQAVFAVGQSNSTLESNGEILGFDVYPNEITSTQAAALYTAQAALVAGGKRVSSIPWLWTKDGDGVVDNCNDSTRDNFCVVGGVPGSEDAITDIDGRLSTGFGTMKELRLSNMRTSSFLSPAELYTEFDTTADANSSNGEYKVVSIGTSFVALGEAGMPTRVWDEIAGQTCLLLARINDQGSNLQMAAGYLYGTYSFVQATYSVTIPNTFVLWPTEYIQIPTKEQMYLDRLTMHAAGGIQMFVKRSTGTANIQVDWTQVVTRPFILLSSAQTIDGFLLSDGHVAYGYDVATLNPVLQITTLGDSFYVSPGKYNNIISATGSKSANPVITVTLTYNRFDVTPRWSLL